MRPAPPRNGEVAARSADGGAESSADQAVRGEAHRPHHPRCAGGPPPRSGEEQVQILPELARGGGPPQVVEGSSLGHTPSSRCEARRNWRIRAQITIFHPRRPTAAAARLPHGAVEVCGAAIAAGRGERTSCASPCTFAPILIPGPRGSQRRSRSTPMPLLEARKTYKPFEYPWAYRILEAPAAAPLAARGSAARRGLPRLGAEAHRSRAQPAHPDLPLLHAGRCRGAGLLPREIRPRVQADRGQDDARPRSPTWRRCTSPPTRTCSTRSACPRANIRPFLQYKEMKDKHDYLQHVRRRQRRGYRAHARDVRRLHRGAAAVRQLRDADELPALQQDEGHGPDRHLVDPRRDACTARASSGCSTPSARSATA